MKIIRLDNQMKQKLIEEYKTALMKEAGEKLAKFANECNKVVPEQKSHSSNEKLKIYYTATAYAKIVQLVFSHSQEVGWNMVVKRYNDGYRVEDVLVYPQKASGAYIEVDLARYGLWKGDPDKVSDDADANLFGQGHSHVNMSVTPSGRDQEQQRDEVQLKGSGFYLFQIWNKRLEINSFFYDIDNNILYEKDDIELIVEDGNTTSTNFIAESKEMLKEEKKEHPITQLPPKGKGKPFHKSKKKDVFEYDDEDNDFEEHAFLDGYYPGYGYYPMTDV